MKSTVLKIIFLILFIIPSLKASASTAENVTSRDYEAVRVYGTNCQYFVVDDELRKTRSNASNGCHHVTITGYFDKGRYNFHFEDEQENKGITYIADRDLSIDDDGDIVFNAKAFYYRLGKNNARSDIYLGDGKCYQLVSKDTKISCYIKTQAGLNNVAEIFR
jgi:hypothetical protein